MQITLELTVLLVIILFCISTAVILPIAVLSTLFCIVRQVSDMSDAIALIRDKRCDERRKKEDLLDGLPRAKARYLRRVTE